MRQSMRLPRNRGVAFKNPFFFVWENRDELLTCTFENSAPLTYGHLKRIRCAFKEG